jgi:hypothetical protein
MKDPFDAEGMEGLRYYAKYLAMVVRNAMEDFHCRHLSDEQMAELNPIIRNAIYTAMYAYHCEKHSNAAARFVDFHLISIPKYWEEPELLPDFQDEP